MSSSRSIDSSGDMAASITSDTPRTPMTNKQQNRPSSPDFDSVSSKGITPINPFESTIIEIPPIPSLSHSGSGLDSAPLQNISMAANDSIVVGVDACVPIQSINTLERPVSPDRSHTSVTITPSHPRSPSSTTTPGRIALSDMSVSSLPIIPTASQIPQQSMTPGGNTGVPHQLLFVGGDPLVQLSPSRVRQSPAAALESSVSPQSRRLFDDDENTEPSSAANTAEHQKGVRQLDGSSQLKTTVENLSGNIKRIFHDTCRRLATKEERKDSDGEDIHSSALIAGYLQKYGRNGKWQTRWFETNGESLSYYRDRRRLKLLATLDLEKVGTIEVDPEDSRECCFSIQVLGRMYYLRADSRTACKDWVITLNRVKEAHLQQGNVTLLNPAFDFLDDNVEVTPRVVVDANRQRTRAVDEAEQWDKVYQTTNDPADPSRLENKGISALSTEVVARWTKRNKTSIQRLGVKVAQWARSVKKFGCEDGDEGNVHLDRHVHPPGHDDKGRGVAITKVEAKCIPDNWSAKQTIDPSLAASSRPDRTIPLAIAAPTACKPVRSLSTTSEDYRTIS